MAEAKTVRLDDQLCFALYAATNTVVRAYRPLLARLGITYPQYLTLMALWEHGKLTVTELADRLALPAHAVTPVISRLQAAGFVAKRRGLRDRRAVVVELTAAGKSLESAAAAAQHQVVCRTGLTSDALADLRTQLHRLVDDMVADAAAETPAHGSPSSRSVNEEGAAS